MSLMKSSIERPYYSSDPLNEKSQWVSFPVEIYVRNRDYSAALSYGREIIQELEKAVAQVEKERCRIGKPEIVEQGYDFETVVNFSKLGNECAVQIYHQIVINFAEGLDLWAKLEVAAHFLDALETSREGYAKDKLVQINLGTRYSLGK